MSGYVHKFQRKEPGDYVRVTTLNAGAGLESPIVFLVGLRELFEEEQSIRLVDDEREDNYSG
jgi:superfamily I DNA/RNA helicase